MIRAMWESGIPIDIVGGTSIGSFVGALWAEELNVTRFTQRAREFSKVNTLRINTGIFSAYPCQQSLSFYAFIIILFVVTRTASSAQQNELL